MAYRAKLQPRAQRDPHTLFIPIHAEGSAAAADRFNGMVDAVSSLEQMPNRCATLPDRPHLRQLLYGSKPPIFRIIVRVDEPARVVDPLHVRHGARDAIAPSTVYPAAWTSS